MTGSSPGGWLDSHGFILLARACSVLGTALAASAVWVFLEAWQDIRKINDTLALLSGTVRVHETIVVEHGRRLDRLETRLFTRSGLVPAPPP